LTGGIYVIKVIIIITGKKKLVIISGISEKEKLIMTSIMNLS